MLLHARSWRPIVFASLLLASKVRRAAPRAGQASRAAERGVRAPSDAASTRASAGERPGRTETVARVAPSTAPAAGSGERRASGGRQPQRRRLQLQRREALREEQQQRPQ